MKTGRDIGPFFQGETLHRFFDLLNAHFENLPVIGQKRKPHL
jgi:hypothetical protein